MAEDKTRTETIETLILKQTAKFQNWLKIANGETEPEEKIELSKKAQKIKDMCDNEEFGCSSEMVAKLCSIIIDEEIPFNEEGEDKDYEIECVLVPFSMIYDKSEEKVVFIGDNRNSQYDDDGDLYSDDELYTRSVRPATPKEIELFIETVTNNNMFKDVFRSLLEII